MKRIGLISDTHGYFGAELKVFLKDVDVVLHCGDWGSIHTFEEVSSFKPVIGVYGNCDDTDIRMEVPLYQHFKLEELDCLMIHIGGYPARYDYRAYQLINQIRPDIFFCGHSHILRVMNDPHFVKQEPTLSSNKSVSQQFPQDTCSADNTQQLREKAEESDSADSSLSPGINAEKKIVEESPRKMLVMNPGACGQMGFHNVRTALRFTVEGRNISDLELGQWPR